MIIIEIPFIHQIALEYAPVNHLLSSHILSTITLGQSDCLGGDTGSIEREGAQTSIECNPLDGF